jgi:predicted RNA binding protein YcfA (HicA-like mRNA interferase family)
VGKGPELKRGPFTAADVRFALRADGWQIRAGQQKGSKHEAWEHPAKPGKFMVDAKWTSLRISDPILKGMVRTTGIEKKRLLRLLNGLDD